MEHSTAAFGERFEASQDPHVVSHPAAALAADLIWFRFAVFYFLRGPAPQGGPVAVQQHHGSPFPMAKRPMDWAAAFSGRCYLLFTLCIFIAGQAVLGNREENFEENVAIFSCRCFLYFGSMCQLLYQQVKLTYVDIKKGTINRSYVFPIPEYLFDEMNNSTGTYIFTENCPEAQDMGAYYIFSCLAMLLYWALLIDFAVISMRLSAFVLVCSRVMSEVGLFALALLFLIVAFATAISSLNHSLLEYDGVQLWLGALLKISLGMFPAADYLRFRDEAGLSIRDVGLELDQDRLLEMLRRWRETAGKQLGNLGKSLLGAWCFKHFNFEFPTEMVASIRSNRIPKVSLPSFRCAPVVSRYARLNRASVVVSVMEQADLKRSHGVAA
eukprot:Skav207156  [mRNA]  locus=scaffold573:283595:295640:+ [translate_table: standard]